MILRPMLMTDADFMLSLKNDSQTRRFALATSAMIKKNNHYSWLKENIQYFKVIEVGEVSCGAVRIQDGEISIWIDSKFRKEGIATMAIKIVSEKGDTAKIVEGNVASMRCFISAGFKPIRHIDNYYIFQL